MPRRDFTKVPFAATGDVTSIPTAVQPDGSVSMASGFGFDYQRDNGAGGGTPDPLAKSIPRDATNGILNEITASIGEIQQNGYPSWVASAAPYPIMATVRHNNVNYRSTITNNNVEPGTGTGSEWVNITASADAALSGGLVVFSTAGITTWTVPLAMQLGLIRPRVYVTGGGGGTGGLPNVSSSNIAISPGGGAGGTAISRVDLTGVSSVSVTVGSAGAAGGTGLTTGGNGGASSFGSFCTGAGGEGVTGVIAPGGVNASASGGLGGTASGGFINVRGGDGTNVIGVGSSLAPIANGNGGSSYWGGGPRQSLGTTTPGCGGGPRALQAGGTQQPGIAGAAGIVVVEW